MTQTYGLLVFCFLLLILQATKDAKIQAATKDSRLENAKVWSVGFPCACMDTDMCFPSTYPTPKSRVGVHSAPFYLACSKQPVAPKPIHVAVEVAAFPLS